MPVLSEVENQIFMQSFDDLEALLPYMYEDNKKKHNPRITQVAIHFDINKNITGLITTYLFEQRGNIIETGFLTCKGDS